MHTYVTVLDSLSYVSAIAVSGFRRNNNLDKIDEEPIDLFHLSVLHNADF